MPTSKLQDMQQGHLRGLWPARQRCDARRPEPRALQVQRRKASQADPIRLGLQEVAHSGKAEFAGSVHDGGLEVTELKTVVIVGGVAGGASAAARLRRLSESWQIIVLERSGYVSFANCGLPYHLSSTIPDRADLLLQTPESLRERFQLDVRVRNEVLSIDREARSVLVRDLDTGRDYQQEYDALILSPGAAPIVPPIPGADRGLVLRDIEDLDRMVEQLTHARDVVVVGGGFIGLEAAENLVEAGKRVTLVELSDQVLAPLDPELAVIVSMAAAIGAAIISMASSLVWALSSKCLATRAIRSIFSQKVGAGNKTILHHSSAKTSNSTRRHGLACSVRREMRATSLSP